MVSTQELKPVNHPICIRAGATYYEEFIVRNKDTQVPLDLTGWTIKAQARPAKASIPQGAPTISFTAEGTDLANGLFALYLSDAQTQAFAETAAGGAMFYDVELTNSADTTVNGLPFDRPGFVFSPNEGAVTFQQQVSD